MRNASLLIAGLAAVGSMQAAEKDRLLIHRIGPAVTTVHAADAGGKQVRQVFADPALDYNVSPSPDGQWLLFTSERDGSADIYRAHTDGTAVERLTTDPAYDDQAAWSPDGQRIAFVSSRGTHTTDIWTLDLRSKVLRNVTEAAGGDFRPSWSPDGRWIAFSSDRGTTIERNAPEWEHLHRTSLYVVAAEGGSARRLTSGQRFAGSPKWSRDGARLVFYEMDAADAHNARTNQAVDSQIVSIDAATGDGRREHTSGPGLKVSPQFLGGDRVGYLVKAGAVPGVAYSTGEAGPAGLMRNPAWSADGGTVFYDRGRAGTERRSYPRLQPMFSANSAFELANLQAFAAFSRDGRRLAMSERVGATNDEYALNVMQADGASAQRVFFEPGTTAMAPGWSPDGNWIVFGHGGGFQTRNTPARVMMMRPDGSDLRPLATGQGAGFPSLSPDGKRLVFRVWGPAPDERGLRVLTLETGVVTRLTDSAYDTFPGWSPTADLIAFSSWRNGDFDIYTIKPDGTGLKQLTTAAGNDAHSSWSPDGQHLMFSSSRFGFKDEAPLFDGQPQPYGEIFVMKADGSDQRPLTDNQWEDGPGAWQPRGAGLPTRAQ